MQTTVYYQKTTCLLQLKIYVCNWLNSHCRRCNTDRGQHMLQIVQMFHTVYLYLKYKMSCLFTGTVVSGWNKIIPSQYYFHTFRVVFVLISEKTPKLKLFGEIISLKYLINRICDVEIITDYDFTTQTVLQISSTIFFLTIICRYFLKYLDIQGWKLNISNVFPDIDAMGLVNEYFEHISRGKRALFTY